MEGRYDTISLMFAVQVSVFESWESMVVGRRMGRGKGSAEGKGEGCH